MTEKLLPCPFCGNEADLEQVDMSPFPDEQLMCWGIGCKICQFGWYKNDKDEAIKAWNHRNSTLEVDKKILINELESVVKRADKWEETAQIRSAELNKTYSDLALYKRALELACEKYKMEEKVKLTPAFWLHVAEQAEKEGKNG